MSTERIQIVRGNSTQPVTPNDPELSSRVAPLTGFLLEEHKLPAGEFGGAFAGHLITVNVGEAYWKEWRTEGRSGRILVPPGAAALCSGQEVWCNWDRPIRFVGLAIQSDVMQKAAHELVKHRVELRPEPGVPDRVIAGFVNSIDWEVRAGCPGGPLLGESLATDLAAFLLRQYSAHPIQYRYYKGGMPRARLLRVIDYIESSLDSDLRIADLADVAAMSPYYFGKLFKQSMGLTVHQYVIRRRMQRAMYLLGKGRLSLREVGAAIGTTNQSQFTRFFHQHAGATPRRYRNIIAGIREPEPDPKLYTQ
jgi:AraC family transcriptional regulator